MDVTMPAVSAARTLDAVTRWCAALPAATYTVTVVPADGAGPVQRRRFTGVQLVGAVGWLRHRNASGAHVYARPDACRHVLLDDLRPDALDLLRRWHLPAVETETSPRNFQLWLTVSEEEVGMSLATEAARLLAGRYGADPGAADGLHLGRLPGLTNRKATHERRDGSFPWVLLRRAEARVDPAGVPLLRDAASAVAVGRGVADRQRRTTDIAGCWSVGRGLVPRTPSEEHAEGMRRIASALSPDNRIDRSRADFSVALRLLRRGMPLSRVEEVVLAGGKGAALGVVLAEAYARRTVEAAAAFLAGGRR